MNEQLLEILKKAYEAATKTGEFLIHEGGILIEQFLQWKMYESGFFILLGIFLIIGIPLMLKICFKKNLPEDEWGEAKFFGKPTRYDWYQPNVVLAYFGAYISIIAGVILSCVFILRFIKILVAPNVYVLEYILEKL